MHATAKPMTKNAPGKRFFPSIKKAFYLFMGVMTLLGLVLNVVLFIGKVFFPSAMKEATPPANTRPSQSSATPWPALQHDPKGIVIPRAGN